MRKLIEFIQSVYVLVLFVILEVMAMVNYAHSTTYTRARMLGNTMQVIGGVHGLFAEIGHYFRLNKENQALVQHIAELHQRLAEYEAWAQEEANDHRSVRLDTLLVDNSTARYRTVNGTVVVNSVNKPDNFIVVNRGEADRVFKDMAVISPEGGMVGSVVATSKHYATVISVLNSTFHTSGKLVDSEYVGSIFWDGQDPNVVILDELSKYADPQPGQEVVTTHISRAFPKGIRIGTVIDAQLDPTGTVYRVRVELATKMSALHDVVLIQHRDQEEIDSLIHN